MYRLMVLGLNHTTAPLAVREKLAFSAAQQRRAIQVFRERFGDAEVVLVSTCNRVELHCARPIHGHPRIEEIIEFLGEFHGIAPAQFSEHLYTHSEMEAVRHLFTVASSLDSMVLGETQILGQVRNAYDLACELKSAGPVLNPLFQRAIAVGRQVMRDTALTEGRVSVASVAVDYARQIFDRFDNKTVLSIGAGKMATLALAHFAMLKPGRLLICNRDLAKAQRLSERFEGQAVPLDGLSDHLVAADIVITSTGSSEPIITRAQFAGLLPARRYRTIFLIDIALPRDVEESVGDLENVYLYNLDDLQQVVARTHHERAGAVQVARTIVEQQVQDYAAWHRAREMGPLIDRLYKRSSQMAMDEVNRIITRLGHDGEEHRPQLEELARRIVNKLLHQPMQTLRSTDGLHSPVTLGAMEKLFGLSSDAPAQAPDTPADAPPQEPERGKQAN
jgi:glutamyl-tRNA reductase